MAPGKGSCFLIFNGDRSKLFHKGYSISFMGICIPEDGIYKTKEKHFLPVIPKHIIRNNIVMLIHQLTFKRYVLSSPEG